MSTFIIAEAGVNHNGSVELAKKLIDCAIEAKCDAVKFQTFMTDLAVSKSAKMAEYQLENVGKEESQYDMIKKLELTFDHFRELKAYCNDKIQFLSSAFDLVSIDFLQDLGLEVFKVPSGEIDNLPYLRKIGGYNKPVILSTGMSNLSDIEMAIEILTRAGTLRKKISILHCNTEYPTPMGDVNLNAMLTIQNAFKLPVGYSDHTLGIEVPIAAVAMGAIVIEKHFTLDRTMDGPDHKSSLEPAELKAMVFAIRNIEQALGNGVKQLSASEKKNKPLARKSLIAQQNIKCGEIFTAENLAVKRPGTGRSPLEWDKVIGSVANKDYTADSFI